MESHGLPGEIQISVATCDHVRHLFVCELRGMIEVKGKGAMLTYLVRGSQRARAVGGMDVMIPAPPAPCL
jgi:hypothetical protein